MYYDATVVEIYNHLLRMVGLAKGCINIGQEERAVSLTEAGRVVTGMRVCKRTEEWGGTPRGPGESGEGLREFDGLV